MVILGQPCSFYPKRMKFFYIYFHTQSSHTASLRIQKAFIYLRTHTRILKQLLQLEKRSVPLSGSPPRIYASCKNWRSNKLVLVVPGRPVRPMTQCQILKRIIVTCPCYAAGLQTNLLLYPIYRNGHDSICIFGKGGSGGAHGGHQPNLRTFAALLRGGMCTSKAAVCFDGVCCVQCACVRLVPFHTTTTTATVLVSSCTLSGK